MITPAHATLFPLLPSDVEELTAKLIEEVHTAHLSVGLKVIVMAVETRNSHISLSSLSSLSSQGSIEHSLQHLGQIGFDMLTHELQTKIKVKTSWFCK